jgi:hypothetical protein
MIKMCCASEVGDEQCGAVSSLERQNIIGFIKKQRLNWLGHVERMAKDNNMKKVKRW